MRRKENIPPFGGPPEDEQEAAEIETAERMHDFLEPQMPQEPEVEDEDFPLPKPPELTYPDVVDDEFPFVH